MLRKTLFLGGLIILAVVLISACGSTTEGPEGAPGPAGPPGPEGPMGPEGPQGETKTIVGSVYAGSSTCQGCHPDIYDLFAQSGHPWKLNPVLDGQPPVYPFSEVPDPPEGYTWEDISYVIGGYKWKARFIDQDGYIITGDEESSTQFNLANPIVGTDEHWVPYNPGEERPYNCGACHTTGYSLDGHQDEREGLIGTWEEPGVQCEACHGPGANHAADPPGVQMAVNRDSEGCGACHARGAPEEVDASGGFIRHHEQYEELFQSKHIVLDCVICHDPHAGVVQFREAAVQTTRTTCENCHFKNARNQSDLHLAIGVECVDCHMPRLIKSAVGDPEKFTGDIRTHMMAIDPLLVEQFIEKEDGTVISASQISLNFACRNCHIAGGKAGAKSDEQLIERAVGYHEITE